MNGRYLLRAQQLLHIADDAPRPIQSWVKEHQDANMYVNVIGVARARAHIDRLPDPAERREFERRLDATLATLQVRGGTPPLAFDDLAARAWQSMLIESSLNHVPKIALQEYAIAVVYGLAVVEHAKAEHSILTTLGVEIEALV